MPSCIRTPEQIKIATIACEKLAEIKPSTFEAQLLLAFRKNNDLAQSQILQFVGAMAKAHPRVPAAALRLVVGGGQ
ncbi:hypothetical protein [Pseudoduganella sp. UC29_71]|uniref:hypothetical protein n=1 Tax=Pseudoduganella sp. UC29_71 TaxID=3350174 RepID=UPI003670931B